MIYDYTCLSCQNTFMLDFPITSDIKNGRHKKARCPKCGSKKVRKVIHKAEIVFKGPGFYINDKNLKR